MYTSRIIISTGPARKSQATKIKRIFWLKTKDPKKWLQSMPGWENSHTKRLMHLKHTLDTQDQRLSHASPAGAKPSPHQQTP
jgi:hypothetical protein